MADIITYPENGITYDADDASGYLATRLSGVYSAEEDFSVTAQGGLSVQVRAGQAWVRPARFKGRSIIMEQPAELTLTAADPVRTRIDRVVLRYQAFPHQKFGTQHGTIARIARTAVDRQEASFVPEVPAMKEAFYRVTVELASQAILAHGRLEPLKPGMMLDAQVTGEREPLSDRLLQPMYSFGGWLGGR